MRWALRSRHAGALAVAAAFLGAVAGVVGNLDLGLPIPGLSGTAPALPLTVLPALILVIVTHVAVLDGESAWTAGAVRSPVLTSGLVTAGSAFVSLLACLAAAEVLGDPTRGALYARDLLSLGLLCWVCGRWGRAHLGPAAPAGLLLLLCLLFARRGDGRLRWWAWLVDRDPWQPTAWAVVVIGVGAAVLVPILRGWPSRHRRGPSGAQKPRR